MELLTASGVWLAVLVGSVVYESRRIKKENEKNRTMLKSIFQDEKDNKVI